MHEHKDFYVSQLAVLDQFWLADSAPCNTDTKYGQLCFIEAIKKVLHHDQDKTKYYKEKDLYFNIVELTFMF